MKNCYQNILLSEEIYNKISCSYHVDKKFRSLNLLHVLEKACVKEKSEFSSCDISIIEDVLSTLDQSFLSKDSTILEETKITTIWKIILKRNNRKLKNETLDYSVLIDVNLKNNIRIVQAYYCYSLLESFGEREEIIDLISRYNLESLFIADKEIINFPKDICGIINSYLINIDMFIDRLL